MSGETAKAESGWTVDTHKALVDEQIARLRSEVRDQKELLKAENASTALNLVVAREALEKRLEGLNELRQEVTNDRVQFVKTDVYGPAHEVLRQQRASDNEKAIALAAQVNGNSAAIAAMQSSIMWLNRLILGALILGLIAWAFQRLTTG